MQATQWYKRSENLEYERPKVIADLRTSPETKSSYTPRKSSESEESKHPECISNFEISGMKSDLIHKLQNVEEFRLKTAKDSWNKSSHNTEVIENDENIPKSAAWREPLWRIIVDLKGNIIKWWNTKGVYGRDDLVGFNFFELMASYNRSYFTSEYGEEIIPNIQKPSVVLRYSLDHSIDDMFPVIVSSKVWLLYSKNNEVSKNKVTGAKIISRLSNKDSTK